MRFIYLSILAITLSFTMNTFAEKPKHKIVNVYFMYHTKASTDTLRVVCAEGFMFLTGGTHGVTKERNEGKAIVQMYGEDNKPMTCPKVKPE